MANMDLRQAVNSNGLKLWQIANKLSLTDGNLSRKLRYELSTAEKKKIFKIISELKKGEKECQID